MGRFLKKILLAVISFFLLAFLFDLLISYGLRQMEDYRFQSWDEIMDGGMAHDILVMGNSRGLSHFVPLVIDSILDVSSYNLGIGGYPVNAQLMKYGLYVSKNALPKAIIYNVDFATMSIMNIRNQHESEQYFPTVYNAYMRKQLLQNGFTLFDVYCPMYRYFGYQMVIKNGLLEILHITHYCQSPSLKGFYPNKGEWNGSELSKMKPKEADIDKNAVELFDKFLAQCYDNNIQVIMVNSPVYYECTEKIVNMETFNALYQDLANKYGFLYLNYTDNYELCNDTSNFCVSVHLNLKAAKRFSRDLSTDLLSLDLFR